MLEYQKDYMIETQKEYWIRMLRSFKTELFKTLNLGKYGADKSVGSFYVFDSAVARYFADPRNDLRKKFIDPYTGSMFIDYGMEWRSERYGVMLELLIPSLEHLLTTSLEAEEKAHVKRSLAQFKYAQAHWTEFDYRVINLCHGKTIENLFWRLDHWCKDKYPPADKAARAAFDLWKIYTENTRAMRAHLDRYLYEGNLESLEAILTGVTNLTEVRDPNVTVAIDKLDLIAESLWAEAAVNGILVDA